MEQNKPDDLFEKSLAESKILLEDASRVAEEDYEFTLESILAEFGGDMETPLPEPKPGPLPPLAEGETPPPEELFPPVEDDEEDDAAEDDETDFAPALDTPQSYSLQQVVERTVQNVLDEQRSEPVLEEKPRRRAFFFRRRHDDADALYENVPEGEHIRKEAEQPEPPPEPAPPEEPEPPIEETVADYRTAAQSSQRAARYTTVVMLLMWVPPLLEHFGWMPALYAEDPLLHVAPFLVALTLVCLLGREVFLYGFGKLFSGKVTYELLTALLCLAALADTALTLFYPPRAAQAALPLHTVAALSMTCALHGRSLLFRALYDTFRIAALGDAPYLVTTTAGGAAKRRGSAEGFSITAQRDDVSGHWQAVVLPVMLVGALVFSVLSTVHVGAWALLGWNLSAVLAGCGSLAFPLVYALPLRRVTRRFTKSGTALAGYVGASTMTRSNCLILTDSDLFPPGTVSIHGLKIYGEESGKVFSYAATMARASESGVSDLFDKLLTQQGGRLETLSDLNFYEEGGVGGTIRGETVLFGTAAFCRRMDVALPPALKLRTGLYLAVDGTLIAAFAVKYLAAENVDWALRALSRTHITPVLAVRDGNITPALLKRKFGTDAHAVYPRLSTRLALSQKEGAKPCALISREGLAPYAELAAGSKRLCRAVRLGNVISLFASAVGMMLAFYLSFLGAYTLFTPLTLAAFLALFALAALIDGYFVDQY
ncbi:MAG: hypothetical protein K6G54_03970 [Oscillospiraceae bacterium]|nr:hypothetical protein [Oscillospiraceae bacterium]